MGEIANLNVDKVLTVPDDLAVCVLDRVLHMSVRLCDAAVGTLNVVYRRDATTSTSSMYSWVTYFSTDTVTPFCRAASDLAV